VEDEVFGSFAYTWMLNKLCDECLEGFVFFNYYLGTFFVTTEVVVWKEFCEGGCVEVDARS